MNFGLPTLVECEGIQGCVDVARKLGLDFVEINMSFPQYQYGSAELKLAKELSDSYGVGYTIHADEQLNPFDFNPKVARCYTEVMLDTIRAAKEIGAKVINLHLLKGVYVTLPGKVILLTDVYRDEYLNRVENFVAQCEREIGDADLRIAIENVDSNPFTDAQCEALDHIFLKSEKFALTLDVGHEDCLGGKDTHVFRTHPEKLIHMHLHDSDGKHPHLPLGTGHINVREKLALVPDDGTCLLEVKTVAGLIESVDYLRREKIRKF